MNKRTEGTNEEIKVPEQEEVEEESTVAAEAPIKTI